MINALRHPLRTLLKGLRFIANKPRFKEYHWSDRVSSTRHITCRHVALGRDVRIGPAARIQAVERYNDKTFSPLISLADGVSIEQNVHLTCANRVAVGENTAIAANVTITDIIHPYEDISLPVERQDIKVLETAIGRDCKIYNGAVILPGVHIGDHCVVGANSVVNRDVPSFSVVAGAPARVVKRYDAASGVWVTPNDNQK